MTLTGGSAPSGTALLAAGLGVSFRALRAVDAVDLEVPAGSTIGLVGPNGAGKSTVLNLLSGYVRPSAGRVAFRRGGRETDLSRAPVAARARLGIGRTFQTPRLVPDLTLRENVELGMVWRGGVGRLAEGFGVPGFGHLAARRAERAAHAIELLDLGAKTNRMASDLSLGEQRLAELARCIAADADLLLLDEPFAGLSGAERDRVVGHLHALRERGIGTLLVEHNMGVIREVCEVVHVLDRGATVRSGVPAEVLDAPEVVEIYMGSPGVTAVAAPAPPPAAPGAPPALRVDGLSVFYGSILATRDVSLEIESGGALGVVGANGAGKSTLLRGIAGLLRSRGSTAVADLDLTGRSAAFRSRHGLAFVPQDRTVFPTLTLRENLRLSWLTGTRRRKFDAVVEQSLDIFPDLAHRLGESAGNLSGGQRQMLAVARGLCACPDVLLLDEPSAGLAPVLVAGVGESLVRLRQTGVTLLLVEQNLTLARMVCPVLHVLSEGHTVWQGPATELDDELAAAAYLGAMADDRTTETPGSSTDDTSNH